MAHMHVLIPVSSRADQMCNVTANDRLSCGQKCFHIGAVAGLEAASQGWVVLAQLKLQYRLCHHVLRLRSGQSSLQPRRTSGAAEPCRSEANEVHIIFV